VAKITYDWLIICSPVAFFGQMRNGIMIAAITWAQGKYGGLLFYG
jgi:hypothetical protein